MQQSSDPHNSAMAISQLPTTEFSNDDKEIFESFLDHDQHNDFVVDFDNVYKWIGFTCKDHAKRLLTDVLMKGTDYKTEEYAQHTTVMLTPNAFNELCIHSRTERGDQVRKYYEHLKSLLNHRNRQEFADLIAQNNRNRLEFADLIAKNSQIEERTKLSNEQSLPVNVNKSMLYVFDTDTRIIASAKRIGFTTKQFFRLKPLYNAYPHGKVVCHVMLPKTSIRKVKLYLCEQLTNEGYHNVGDFFNITTDLSRLYLTEIKQRFQIGDITDPAERGAVLGMIVAAGNRILNTKDAGTQT